MGHDGNFLNVACNRSGLPAVTGDLKARAWGALAVDDQADRNGWNARSLRSVGRTPPREGSTVSPRAPSWAVPGPDA
ncbi:hypothetical protein ACFWHQ_39305 [Streptomyces sp. NPDC060334]|uniref:hypothetical protein n=1 Tax=Streptomyces sp. NPDC060334 TaxID=3347099 RepID=UPI00365EC937